MVTPYDTSKPITKMFIQFYKVLQIVNASNTPFKNAQIIAKTYILVQKNVIYSEERKAWDRHPEAEKNGLNFISMSETPKLLQVNLDSIVPILSCKKKPLRP